MFYSGKEFVMKFQQTGSDAVETDFNREDKHKKSPAKMNMVVEGQEKTLNCGFKLFGEDIEVVSAQEPSDIIWENLEIP